MEIKWHGIEFCRSMGQLTSGRTKRHKQMVRVPFPFVLVLVYYKCRRVVYKPCFYGPVATKCGSEHRDWLSLIFNSIQWTPIESYLSIGREFTWRMKWLMKYFKDSFSCGDRGISNFLKVQGSYIKNASLYFLHFFIHPKGFVVEDQRDICSCISKAICAVPIIVIAIVIFRDYL